MTKKSVAPMNEAEYRLSRVGTLVAIDAGERENAAGKAISIDELRAEYGLPPRIR